MHINDIRQGADVNLEIVSKDGAFDVNTSAVGTHNDRLLLRAFHYKGQVLDFGNKGFKKLSFNIYTNDPEGNRVCWKGVKINLVSHKDRYFYAIEPNKFHAISVENDRRKQRRESVNMAGNISCSKAGVYQPITVYNISDTGIAVISKTRLPIRAMICEVSFSDNVNDTQYDLDIECRCVREENLPRGGYLYGFTISDASAEMINYVYIQKVLERSKR